MKYLTIKVPVALTVSCLHRFDDVIIYRGASVLPGPTTELPPNIELILPEKDARELVDRYGGIFVDVPHDDIRYIERERARKIMSHPSARKHMKEAGELIMSDLSAKEARDKLTNDYL